MMLSQLDLEDVEALYLGPSFLTADPMGPLLDQDEEEALSPSSSLEGKVPASLPLSFTSDMSSPSPFQSFLSPSSSPSSPRPASPSSLLETKAGMVSLSLPWLEADLLDAHVGADDCKDDAFAGMEWMSEKIDLSDLDLDSLMGSCSPDEPPSSPETLLLDPHMDLELELLPLPGESATMATGEEVALKSEPASPPPPSPPLHTLELGSEVDVLDVEKAAVHAAEPRPLLPPDQPAKTPPPPSDCDSDSGIESSASSPARLPSPPRTPSPAASSSSSRTKPYTKPEPAAAATTKPPRVKSASGAPRVVERKLKKMEQNKTAATRYRQKKRVEQELLNEECEELERRNQQLADKADSISREIQYLRDLMEEVRKHRRGRAPRPDPPPSPSVSTRGCEVVR